MAKRKKTQTKQSSNILTYIAMFLALVALAIGAIIAGYFIGYDEASGYEEINNYSTEQKKQSDFNQSDKKSIHIRLKEILKEDNTTTKKEVIKNIKKIKKDNITNTKKEIIENIKVNEEENATNNKKETVENIKITKEENTTKKNEVIKNIKIIKVDISASHEYESLPKSPRRKFVRTATKPRLAIIIDDVSVKSQIKAIKGLNLVLTMSFLPPSKNRPNSSALAAKEKFYMVHLPMEAISYTREEPFTLRTSDNQNKIFARVWKIKQLFPRVRYINNHTGSKFTADEISVNRLINVLNKLNINFVDSRTTAKTKVPRVMKNYGLKYVARDVFLDHKMDKAYVKKQIKEAIRVAKKHGTAIAIGHPHKNTLLALAESKHLLKEVELVLVNGLY
jgi:polysaccharide deacetylase 2 family uncharacterized protein YibQ